MSGIQFNQPILVNSPIQAPSSNNPSASNPSKFAASNQDGFISSNAPNQLLLNDPATFSGPGLEQLPPLPSMPSSPGTGDANAAPDNDTYKTDLDNYQSGISNFMQAANSQLSAAGFPMPSQPQDPTDAGKVGQYNQGIEHWADKLAKAAGVPPPNLPPLPVAPDANASPAEQENYNEALDNFYQNLGGFLNGLSTGNSSAIGNLDISDPSSYGNYGGANMPTDLSNYDGANMPTDFSNYGGANMPTDFGNYGGASMPTSDSGIPQVPTMQGDQGSEALTAGPNFPTPPSAPRSDATISSIGNYNDSATDYNTNQVIPYNQAGNGIPAFPAPPVLPQSGSMSTGDLGKYNKNVQSWTGALASYNAGVGKTFEKLGLDAPPPLTNDNDPTSRAGYTAGVLGWQADIAGKTGLPMPDLNYPDPTSSQYASNPTAYNQAKADYWNSFNSFVNAVYAKYGYEPSNASTSSQGSSSLSSSKGA